MQCFKFIKVMMILFNLLIFLCGAALLAVGIWVSVDGTSFLKAFGSLSSSAMQFVNVGYFLIAAGAVLFILGFLGCYGAHSENKCVLMMFFSILLIIFIAEIAGAVVALVYTTMAEQFLTFLVVPAIEKDYGYQTEFTQVWNSTMEGVRWAGRIWEWRGEKNQGTISYQPHFVCSCIAVASTITQILTPHVSSKRTKSFLRSVAPTTLTVIQLNHAPRTRPKV